MLAIENNIATLTFNRPEKRNALNGEMIAEFLKILAELKENKNVGLLLITATGEHFCAGADLDWMLKISQLSATENYDDAQQLADLLHQLYFFPKPSIALVQGAVMGGGLGLLSACDIAFAAKNSVFCFSEVKIGLAPSMISPYVIAAIGERHAHYYFLTAERFDANEAYRIGLIQQICENTNLLSEGLKLAKRILQNSPHALSETKQLLRYVSKEKISAPLAQKTAEHLANLRGSPDAQEGLQAFLQKRNPQWEL